ncbi:MAG: hypothetical protein WED04_08000 [Promethearchaeati archaeon SRVP18_Atabeyarchaeia-1]
MSEIAGDTVKLLNTLLTVIKDRATRKNLNIMLERINGIHDRLIKNRILRDERKDSERFFVSLLADCSKKGECTRYAYTSGGCKNRGKEYCLHRQNDENTLKKVRRDIQFYEDIIRDDEKNLEESCNTIQKIVYTQKK